MVKGEEVISSGRIHVVSVILKGNVADEAAVVTNTLYSNLGSCG